MTAQARKAGSGCPTSNGLVPSDTMLVIAGGNNAVVNTTILFANTPVPHVTVGNNALSTANLILRTSSAPANSSANGVAGRMVWDSGYLYVCIATNSWKRVALGTF